MIAPLGFPLEMPRNQNHFSSILTRDTLTGSELQLVLVRLY